MSDLSKLNGIDMLKFDLKSTVDICQSIQSDMEENRRNRLRTIEATQRERRQNEEEKRENLKRIADNSEDTVNALKETNELLKQSNELLRRENEGLLQKLDETNKIISNLFELEKENGEDQKELLRQAVALAVQIDTFLQRARTVINWCNCTSEILL